MLYPPPDPPYALASLSPNVRLKIHTPAKWACVRRSGVGLH